MRFPSFFQALVLVILWAIVTGFLGLGMATNLGAGLVWIWFLWGLFTGGDGFEWSDLRNPTKLVKVDIMGEAPQPAAV